MIPLHLLTQTQLKTVMKVSHILFLALFCCSIVATQAKVTGNQTNEYAATRATNAIYQGNRLPGKWEISLNGGYSYMLAKVSKEVPSDFHNYIKSLKSGYHLGAGVGYFWVERMGAGIKYSRFGSKGRIGNVTITNNLTGEMRHGIASDNIAVQFIGPTFHIRQAFAQGKLALHASYSIGYLAYNNNSTVVSEAVKISGSSIGTSADVNLSIPLGKRIAIQAGASLLSGKLQTLHTTQNGGRKTTEKLDSDKQENLSRVDLSAGIRLYL